MIRTLKVLGLALAVCSLGAVYASGASATTDVFTCGNSTCFLEGEQFGAASENVLGVKGAGVETHCTGATFKSSTVTTGASSATVSPSYTGCTTAGSSSPVDPNGCTFTLSGVTDPFTNTNGASEGEKGTASVSCSGTNKVVITGSGCAVSFGSQANLKGVTYENTFPVGKPDDVDATITIDNITYTAAGSLCDFLGFSTPGGNNAFLTEKVTVRAFEDVNGSQGPTQINLTVS
jgi:hypothetical protein